MNAIQFAKALVDCAPEVKRLKEAGMTEADALLVRAAYICKPRLKRSALREDPVCELLAMFDVSQVEIGMVSFLKDPLQKGPLIQIGRFEADPLEIQLPKETIVVHELGSKGHILAKCASTPGQFLDALAIAARVLARCSSDSALACDIQVLRSTAKECSEAAGGLEYEPFFTTLLGAW